MKRAVFILSLALLLPAAARKGDAAAYFPAGRWPTLKALMEDEGPGAVVEYILAYENPVERLMVFYFARPAFANRRWEGKNLDDLVVVGEAGIAEALAQAEAAVDEETRREKIRWADVEAYNLAADLAECWPGDDLPRESRHFEKGVELANRCLDWRLELGEGHYALGLAFWVRGMHELSLGHTEWAREDFEKALEHSQAHAVEEGLTADCVRGGEFTVALNTGYLGLALGVQRKGMGSILYHTALGALWGTVADFPEAADDAMFGIEQLEKVFDIFIGIGGW
jgi:hypothetical protein